MRQEHVTPVHPGEVLQDELEETGLTQTALANHIGVLPKTINEICRGKRGISADMAMKLDAARLLVYRAATGAGKGLPSIYEASMSKCYANEMVREVTDKAMQIFGGYGYSKEYPIERMLRDARAWGVAGGTLQMLRITMASMIFGRRFDQRK